MSHVHIVAEEIAELRAQIAEIKDQNKSINLSELREYLIGLEKSSKVEVTGLGYGGCGVGGIRQSPLNLFAKDLFKNASSITDTIPSLQPPSDSAKQENTLVNMDEYMANYTEWVKGGLAHACNEAVCISSLMNPRKYKEYHVNPPTYVKNLPVIPQKREFKIINKETKNYLYCDNDSPSVLNPSRYSHMPQGYSIWTLEPV